MADEGGEPPEGPGARPPGNLEDLSDCLSRLDGTQAAKGALDAGRANLARPGYTPEQIAKFEEAFSQEAFPGQSLGEAARWNAVLARYRDSSTGKPYVDWVERLISDRDVRLAKPRKPSTPPWAQDRPSLQRPARRPTFG